MQKPKNYYFLIPIIGAIPWGGMLTAMLIAWSIQGHPIYWFIHRHQIPVYISHIGATNLQPLFISCSAWQGLLYVITIVTEYLLRKAGKLQYWFTKRERNLLFIACITGGCGQVGIILCAIFDTKDHPTAHTRLLALFIIGVLISMISIITQYCMMAYHYTKIHVSHKRFNKFAISAILKSIWLACAIVFAVIFKFYPNNYNVRGYFEWILAYSYLFLFSVFAYDLYPASKREHKNFPYIKDWNNRGYYLYDKNFGDDEKTNSFDNSHEAGDTLVQNSSNDGRRRPIDREFTDEELAQYPINNNETEYPIPHGQSVRVYDRV